MCAAGNTTNSLEEGITAKNTIWTSVTAVEMINGLLSYPWYNSYGSGSIDLICFSNLEVLNVNERQYGTSFSSPFVVGLIGQYYDTYKTRFGYYPTPDQAKDFIFKISKPIVENRIKEGYGIPILPNFDTFDFGLQLQIDNKIINHSGAQIPFDVAPQIIDNRTMIPIAMLREIGIKVYWDAKNKRINVEK